MIAHISMFMSTGEVLSRAQLLVIVWYLNLPIEIEEHFLLGRQIGSAENAECIFR